MANYPYYGGFPYGQPTFPMQRPEYLQSAPQMAPQTPQSPGAANAPAGFACRPVTSKEEAMAVQVDFFGPGTVMPDLAHGVIYLKRFNQQTGACDIFEFFAAQQRQEEPVKYATMEDLQALREELLQARKAGKKNETSE